MALNLVERNWRVVLIAIVVGAMLVRFVWVWRLPADEPYLERLPDQLEYLELGRSLLRGEGLRFFDEDFQDVVYAYRAPGYPLLVAAADGSVRAVRLVQVLIDASTVIAAYMLARRWLGRGGGVSAALLVAVNPYLIFFTGLILSETLFTGMLTWGMALIVRRPQILPLKWWAWGGWWGGAVLLALSVLVRPSAAALPVLLGVVSALTNRGGPAPYYFRWHPPVGATMLALILLALLPWAYRNHRILGSWIWTTTNSGITLYDGFNPDATGASDQAHVRQWPQLRRMSEVQRSEYLSDLAWQYIREHPERLDELTLTKIARTWSPVPLSEEYGVRRNVVIAFAYMAPFYLLILAGVWFGKASTSAKLFLLLPAVYFTAVHAMSVGSLRYRVPSDVPMAVLAAAGAAALMEGHRRSRPTEGEVESAES